MFKKKKTRSGGISEAPRRGALDLISRAPSLGGRTWRLDVYHVTSDCGNRRSLPAFPSLGLGTAGSRRAGTVAGASPDGL